MGNGLTVRPVIETKQDGSFICFPLSEIESRREQSVKDGSRVDVLMEAREGLGEKGRKGFQSVGRGR